MKKIWKSCEKTEKLWCLKRVYLQDERAILTVQYILIVMLHVCSQGDRVDSGWPRRFITCSFWVALGQTPWWPTWKLYHSLAKHKLELHQLWGWCVGQSIHTSWQLDHTLPADSNSYAETTRDFCKRAETWNKLSKKMLFLAIEPLPLWLDST